jgi:hypothetical protein
VTCRCHVIPFVLCFKLMQCSATFGDALLKRVATKPPWLAQQCAAGSTLIVKTL